MFALIYDTGILLNKFRNLLFSDVDFKQKNASYSSKKNALYLAIV